MVLLLTGLALGLVLMVVLAILATQMLQKSADRLDGAIEAADRQGSNAT
jgi:hypothetical protein